MHVQVASAPATPVDISMSSPSTPSQSADAFDGSAEPTVYMSENRMPAMIEFSSTLIYIIFAALLLALLVILPGVRKTKLTSFLGLLALLTMGASILLALGGSHWLTGSVQLNEAPYGALTSEAVTGKLEVNIGLSSTNVSLVGRLSGSDEIKLVNYNERFYWNEPERMAKEHKEALKKGLPYPILSLTEFLSQDSDGFSWMRQLRQAGYFSSLALYAALASWCLTAAVMCALPVYLPHMMQITGALTMASVWIYTMLIQSPNSFTFQMGGNSVEFVFGFTYVTTFLAGAMSMFAGILLFVLQMSSPHKQLTIMDSEQYVEDQKSQFVANIASQATAFANINKLPATPVDDKPKRELTRTDSVIIPIADIEKNFKPTQS